MIRACFVVAIALFGRTAAATPAGAVDLAPAGDTSSLVIDGAHVYWASHDDQARTRATVRRAPLAGGPVEILAQVGELGPLDPSVAVVGGAVFVTQLDRPASRRRGYQPYILRIDRGIARPFARHGRGLASAALVAHEGWLYWMSASSIGPGPVVATDPRTGRTRQIAPCRDAEIDCVAWLPTPSPWVVEYRRGGSRLRPVARRGLGRGVPLRCNAVAVIGADVHCVPEWSGDGDRPVASLAPLDGRPPVAAPGLDEEARLVAGHYYHLTKAGLVRRAGAAAGDQLVVAGATVFAASRDALVWIEGGRIWGAPLPR